MRHLFRRARQGGDIEMRNGAYMNLSNGNGSNENHFNAEIILGEPFTLSTDCFTLVLSFLSGRDKVKAALICKLWKKVVYTPVLWPVLDLSSYANTVHNLLLDHILNKHAFRFIELRVLRLEGCSALTSGCLKIITENCPYLEVLLLTGCSKINPKAIVSAVPSLPHLKKIELFGVTDNYAFAELLRRKYPWLDLGMFWLQYLASIGREDPLMLMNGFTGARTRHFDEVEFPMNDPNEPTDFLNFEYESKAEINQFNSNIIIDRDYQYGQISPKTIERFEQGRPGLKVAVCRYAGGFVGGCWHRVTGRVVYSNNQFYHRGGNYPREVLYSCEAHRDEDFKDEDLHWCRACERFTRESSFFGEMTCKVCHDEKILQNGEIWIPLTDFGIKNFSFNNVLSHTLNMADRRNLSSTLQHYGSTKFTLDLTFEDETGNLTDYSEAPIKSFWTANAQRIRLQVHDIKKKLLRAKKNKETRALLLYNGNEQIQV